MKKNMLHAALTGCALTVAAFAGGCSSDNSEPGPDIPYGGGIFS